jgi:hypothetical protein
VSGSDHALPVVDGELAGELAISGLGELRRHRDQACPPVVRVALNHLKVFFEKSDSLCRGKDASLNISSHEDATDGDESIHSPLAPPVPSQENELPHGLYRS